MLFTFWKVSWIMINMVNSLNLIESMLLYISQWSSPGAEKKVTVKPELNTPSFHVCGFDLFIDSYVEASIQSQELMLSCYRAGDEKLSYLPGTTSFHTPPGTCFPVSVSDTPFTGNMWLFLPVVCTLTGTSIAQEEGHRWPTPTCPSLFFIPSLCPF